MPGFGKENLNSKQDDEPPETRAEQAKSVRVPACPMTPASGAFRKRLQTAVNIRPWAADITADAVGFRLQVLKDLIKSLQTPALCKDIVDPNLDAVFELIAANIFRPVRAAPSFELSSDTDEPLPAVSTGQQWAHLHPVYQALHLLFMNPALDKMRVKDLADGAFLNQYLDLFESADSLERETLKITLHRIYVYLVSRRKQIRAKVHQIFEEVSHDLRPHPGLNELLEFHASVVSGFQTPLSSAHLSTFTETVLPLHKLPNFRDFQKEFGTCLKLYVCKDRTLAPQVTRAMLRYWPKSSARKEAAFLTHLLSLVEHFGGIEMLVNSPEPVLRRLALSVASFSSVVCDKALLFFLNSAFMASVGRVRRLALSLLKPAVKVAKERQWSKNIMSVLEFVEREFERLEKEVGDDHSTARNNYARQLACTEEHKRQREAAESQWQSLAVAAQEEGWEGPLPQLAYTEWTLPS